MTDYGFSGKFVTEPIVSVVDAVHESPNLERKRNWKRYGARWAAEHRMERFLGRSG